MSIGYSWLVLPRTGFWGVIEPLLLSLDSGMGDHGEGAVHALGDVLGAPLPLALPILGFTFVTHPNAPGVTILSRNLITGNSAFMPAGVAGGELGKGK
jgi:hypothetical protein